MSNAFPWQCPFCKRHATVTDPDLVFRDAVLPTKGPAKNMVLRVGLVTCPNPTCKKFQLRATLYKALLNVGNQLIRTEGSALRIWELEPASSAIIFPDFVPQQIRDDYAEACSIVSLSPKAAATLARRCLQGMIRDVWKVRKSNLAKAIEAIKKKIEPEAWKAIDGVRTLGNIGAHMEKDVNLIVPVEPKEAAALLRLIEALVEDWYVKPRERQALYAKVATVAQQKADARKPLPTPTPPSPAPALPATDSAEEAATVSASDRDVSS